MSSQDDFAKVKACIIDPCIKRWGGLDQGYADDLVDLLGGFSAEVLEAAMRKVRLSCNRRPPISKFLDAAKEAEFNQQSGGAPGQGKTSVFERQREQEDRISKLAGEYMMTRFFNSEMAMQAKKEGWYSNLFSYVKNAAFVQAQIIAGARHIGYDSVCLGLSRPFSEEDVDAIITDFLRSCKEQSITGTVDVAIPGTLLTMWRDRAAARPQAPMLPLMQNQQSLADAVGKL